MCNELADLLTPNCHTSPSSPSSPSAPTPISVASNMSTRELIRHIEFQESHLLSQSPAMQRLLQHIEEALGSYSPRLSYPQTTPQTEVLA